jgi:hypothetical protein
MRWIDRIPLALLILLAVWMAVAPIHPEPHLVEKSRMLFQGNLTKPLDIFDLLYHLVPMSLLAVRVWRLLKARAP